MYSGLKKLSFMSDVTSCTGLAASARCSNVKVGVVQVISKRKQCTPSTFIYPFSAGHCRVVRVLNTALKTPP